MRLHPFNTLAHASATPSDRLQCLGVAGLYLFSLSAWASTALSYWGVGLMLLPLALKPRIIRLFWQDPLIRLSVAFTVLVVGSMLWAGYTFPKTWRYQLKEAKDLLQMGFFLIPLVAFWICDDPERGKRVLGLALIGFMARLSVSLMGPEGLAVVSDPMTYRLSAGMPANAFGVYASIAMLGIVVLAPDMWGSPGLRRAFRLKVVLWSVVFLILFQGMLFSQSRSAWAALFIILPVLVAVLFWENWRRSDIHRKKQLAWMLAAGIVLTGTLLAVNRNILANRMLTSSDSIAQISKGNISGMSLPAISLGLRFYLWKYGWEYWKKRPIFGWGPGGARYLLDRLKDPNLKRIHPEGIENFHNSFVQVAMQLGIVGILFCAGFLVILFQSAWRAFREGHLSLDLFLTVSGAWFLFLCATCSNIRTDDHFGQFFAYLFGGIAYGHRFISIRKAAFK